MHSTTRAVTPFIKYALNIRNNLLEESEYILNPKNSKYNSEQYIDKCSLCEASAEDVHHIQFQSSADKDGFIDHFHKNSKFNLISLCKTCHNKIHNNEIEIKKIQTAQGNKIIKNIIKDKDNTSRLNWTIEQVNKIKELQGKMSKNKISKMEDFKGKNGNYISLTTISKIWNNSYGL